MRIVSKKLTIVFERRQQQNIFQRYNRSKFVHRRINAAKLFIVTSSNPCNRSIVHLYETCREIGVNNTNIRQSIELPQETDALDNSENITHLSQHLANIPIDCQMGIIYGFYIHRIIFVN